MCENGNPNMENQIHEFGSFRISSLTRKLLRDGVEISLTGREFDTLWALIQHPGVPLTQSALSEEVWKGANVTENNLRRQISSLRRKLGPDSEGNDYILTIPNKGYQFVADVVRVEEEVRGRSIQSEVNPAAAQENGQAVPDSSARSTEPPRSGTRLFRSLRWLAPATAVVVAACGGLGAPAQRDSGDGPPPDHSGRPAEVRGPLHRREPDLL